MKKIIFLLVLPMALMGCKQRSSTDGSTNSDSVTADTAAAPAERSAKPAAFATIDADTCDYYLPIKTQTAVNQITWLKNHKTEICGSEEYLKCLVRYHQITQTAYDSAMVAYWNTATPKYTDFAYSTFTGQECDFIKYYVFSADKNHLVSNALKPFNTTLYNYSVPFFKGLPLAFTGVTATSTLKFTQGKIGGVETIIFKIDGVADAYFDYSKIPSGIIN